MFIALVGMSGCGKSKWGRKLHDELGFDLYSCDSIIEEFLQAEIKDYSKQGTQALAEWMGTPFDSRYSETKQRYLDFEKDSLLRAIRAIEAAKQKPNLADRPNIVIDTTGSVIYLDADILSSLRSLATVVYLETPPISYDQLCRRYLNKPKPIIWDESFHPRPGEDKHTTLARCLKDLVKTRSGKYKSLAQVCLDFDNHNAMTLHSSEFIDIITTALNNK